MLYSEVEEDLRASVRALLADRGPWIATLARCETDQPYDIALWKALAADLGCAGLAVPEEYGGAGASWREVAVVAEEIGRAVAPVPFLTSAVIATAAVLALDDEPIARELAQRLATGETTVVPVIALSTAPDAPFPSAVRANTHGRLTGSVTSVADSGYADLLLVPAMTESGEPALYVVDVETADVVSGLTCVAVPALDLTRPLYDVTLADAPARLVAQGDRAVAAYRRSLTTGAAILASEQLGVAEAALELALGYLKTRHQFGRLIGSYQGLKHRAADLWASVAQARAVARYAAACVADDDPDAPVAVALAQAFCSGTAVRAAEECVQFHGGIGFTWEHPAHLYLKRAKSTSIALGTAARHRAALGRLVDLQPAPAQAD
ncbi:MAG: acyl-CoA dehydrogenase family protein [Actinocrinis sp.]